MKIYKYEDSLAEIKGLLMPTVFLAGPTVRGHQQHLTSWRPDAIAEFERQGFDGALILPEFTIPTESDVGKLWIPRWEFAGLVGSDVNMIWLPRTRELIGLITNFEHGYWLGSNPKKLVYGRPDDSYRNTYNDEMMVIDAIQGEYTPRPTYRTLEETVAAAIELANKDIFKHRGKSKVPVESPYGAF